MKRRRFLFGGVIAIAAILPFSTLAEEAEEKVKIGIIGSGNVGSAIGAVWVDAGHEVMFSSRSIEHDRALAGRLGGGARAGTPREAAAFGDVVMVSVPYHALPDVGEEAGDLLEGKVVIDTNNPFPNRDGEIADWAREKGAGLATAELLPGARLVRAFNAIGADSMGSQHEDPGSVGMPIAGDDAEDTPVLAVRTAPVPACLAVTARRVDLADDAPAGADERDAHGLGLRIIVAAILMFSTNWMLALVAWSATTGAAGDCRVRKYGSRSASRAARSRPARPAAPSSVAVPPPARGRAARPGGAGLWTRPPREPGCSSTGRRSQA